MKFILIVTWIASQGYANLGEFHSLAACRGASETLQAASPRRDTTMFCLAKGSEPRVPSVAETAAAVRKAMRTNETEDRARRKVCHTGVAVNEACVRKLEEKAKHR